jgi:preprotein translocase subunit SecY
VIPKLEQWQQEGQVGRRRSRSGPRYLTIALAIIQSTGFVFALHQGKGGLLGFAGFQGRDLIPTSPPGTPRSSSSSGRPEPRS